MMGPVPSDHCAALQSPNYTNFSISIFILLGILVSYLTQHYRIIARRSSEGISPYFVLLGTTSGTCAFANILVLPISRADLECCKVIGGFECFAGLLGILQVGLQWSCFAVILLLFLLFFPHASSLSANKPVKEPPSYRTALIVTGVCVVHAFATGIVNIVVINKSPSRLQAYANFLGIASAVLASIQYLPQLYTTWRLKSVGSLSIPMMLIQTPGSFLWAGSLAARVGWEGWSTWGVYTVTGVLQGCVLTMGIIFEFRNRRMRYQGSADAVDSGRTPEDSADDASNESGEPQPNTETTPLLGNER